MAVKHTIRIKAGQTEHGRIIIEEKEIELTPLRAIRRQCIECMGFDKKEVQLCTSPLCSLFPFRLGKDPSLVGKRRKSDTAVLRKARQTKQAKKPLVINE